MAGETRFKAIPIGIDDFKEVRQGNYYFVDKSELISDILADRAKVYLFTRPRRFGKSLNLSMLDAFFNVKYKGNNWFDGLKISEYEGAEPEKNSVPVIYFNMKDLSVDDYGAFIQDLNLKISRLFQEYNLGDGVSTSPENMDIYKRGRAQKLNESELRSSVAILCHILQDSYGFAPIVLIDEYDNPINNAFNKQSYGRIIEFLRNFYSSTFKSNEHLKFAAITGVMQIAKETIFSGLNNLYVNNVLSKEYDERYGFTEPEVEELCTYYGHEEKYGEAKEWYDGYRFGDAEIYNPWSILNYIKSGFEPAPYWAGTSGNDIIDNLLDHADEDTYSKLVSLGNGQTIEVMLSPRVVMNDLASDRNAIYSVMVMAGYLKAVPLTRGYEISIPNAEMMRVFETMMMHRIHSDAEIAFGNLFDGMEVNDTALMERSLRRIMDENIPFILLSRERDYQLIIGAAAMGRLGRYTVSLEEEAGDGRADILMKPNRAGLPNIVLELKKTDSGDPRECAVKALCQIKEREYFRSLSGKVFIYGLCFRGKDFALLSEEISR